MKVLMIPSWYGTPAAPLLGSFFREQAEALAARGVEVAVAYTEVNGDRGGHGLTCETVGGVPTWRYVRLNLTPRWEGGRCRQRTRMLARLYRQIAAQWGRPDVVNLRSSLQGYEALALCRRERLPLFFMEHSSAVLTEPADSSTRRRLAAVMRGAAVNACVSGALRAVMQPYGDTRIIPDPVDGERFAPVSSAPREAFTFRAMGQLRPLKGFDLLIDAFALAAERAGKPVRLDIAGTGGQREALQARIARHGLEDRCRLVGAVPREEAPAFINGCDCFVCSSHTETLSCVLNEAGACGKPVISTRCGGPLDIVTDERGLLVPVGDAPALAQAMVSMMDTVGRYDPARIRALTLDQFGADKVCDALLAACRDAAAGRPVD